MTEPFRQLMDTMEQSLENALSCHWHPAADVYRTPDGLVARFELAGVSRQDVTVRAAGHRLTILGRRRDRMVEARATHVRMEIAYSEFERTIELPVDLDSARIETDLQDGMLVVRVSPGQTDTETTS